MAEISAVTLPLRSVSPSPENSLVLDVLISCAGDVALYGPVAMMPGSLLSRPKNDVIPASRLLSRFEPVLAEFWAAVFTATLTVTMSPTVDAVASCQGDQ